MATDEKRPYALGFNGHARSCDCEKCATVRAERISQLWEENGQAAVPKTLDATVFVRSHFRRQSNHLQRFPETRKMMRSLLRLIKDKRS